MKIALSGLTRRERLDQCLSAQFPHLVLDYALAQKMSEEELNTLRDDCEWLVLDFDLNTRWNRVKKSWGDAAKRSSALTRIESAVKGYAHFAENNQRFFDVICVPYLPIEEDLGWEKFLKTIDRGLMLTVRSLDDLEVLIPQFSYLAIASTVELDEAKTRLRPLKALLRSFSCHIHSWGAVSKESCLSGVFKSASSSGWLSGGQYGNTYEYVGNLKLTLTHGSKGAGKSVRNRLKAKCQQLGIDHASLQSDDRTVVDQWNLSQWFAYTSDAGQVGGYWSERVPKVETTLPVSTSKTLAHSADIVEYSRFCNSCFLSEQCPMFVADSACRIPTTPQVKNPDDVTSLLNKVIQIQGDRVMFSAYAERVQNAGINPEVSKELETLTKLMKDAREIASPIGGDEVMIKAKGSGVISRLFGGYGRASGGTKPSMSEKIIDVSPLEDDNE